MRNNCNWQRRLEHLFNTNIEAFIWPTFMWSMGRLCFAMVDLIAFVCEYCYILWIFAPVYATILGVNHHNGLTEGVWLPHKLGGTSLSFVNQNPSIRCIGENQSLVAIVLLAAHWWRCQNLAHIHQLNNCTCAIINKFCRRNLNKKFRRN